MEKPATISFHSGHVAGAGFAPDGQTLVSGGVNNRVQRWPVPVRRLLRRSPDHEESVDTLSPSPYSRFSVSGINNAAIGPCPLVFGAAEGTLAHRSKAAVCKTVFGWSLRVMPFACRQPRRRIAQGIADGGVVQ